MADIISGLRTLYFANIPLRLYPQGLPSTVESFLTSRPRKRAAKFLKDLLDATVRNSLDRDYPIAYDFRIAFLKWLVKNCEMVVNGDIEEEDDDERMCDSVYSTTDPFEDVYNIYVEAANPAKNSLPFNASSNCCYKTFFYPPHVRISLQESRTIISSGTTGLTSWSASFFMIDWMEKIVLDSASSSSSSSLLSGKNVLELGSGAGLAGIYAILRTASSGSGIKSFRFSDCHPAVLSTLHQNVSTNVPVDVMKSCAVGVVELDWSRDYFTYNDEDPWFPDVIFGCDVIFDIDVVLDLVRVLKHFLTRDPNSAHFSLRSPPVALIASTIRNPETYDFFLSKLAEAGLIYEVVASHGSVASIEREEKKDATLRSCNDEGRQRHFIDTGEIASSPPLFSYPFPSTSFRYSEACVDVEPKIEIIRIQDRTLRDDMEMNLTFMPRVIASELEGMSFS